MSIISRLFNFTAGTRIQSSQVDAELDQLVTGHNNHDTRIVAAEGEITVLEGQVLDLVNGEIPNGTIDYAKLASDVIAAFVNATGDTMTGDLTIDKDVPGIVLDANRTNNSKIFWNANSANDFGVGIDVDGKTAVSIYSDGRLLVSANDFATSGRLFDELLYKPHVSGTYTGNGAATRDIALPFTPSAVLVTVNNGLMFDSVGIRTRGGLAVTGSPVIFSGVNSVTIGTNKFTVAYVAGDIETNTSGTIYNYIAFR